jgi:hypothetical protein
MEDIAPMMEQNAALMGETMNQMESDAHGDYLNSFEPAEAEGQLVPGYSQPSPQAEGEYIDAIEEYAEPEQPQAQEQQQPYSFDQVAEIAGAVADGLITDQGAAFIGPNLYRAFSKYTEAEDMYDGAEKDAALKAANHEITKNLLVAALLFQADILPRVMPDMISQGIDSSSANDERESEQYTAAREKVSEEFPELYNMRPADLEHLADAYAAETGRELTEEVFYNPRTGKPLSASKNAIAQYRHGLSWARGRGYTSPYGGRFGRARDGGDAEMDQLVGAFGNRNLFG